MTILLLIANIVATVAVFVFSVVLAYRDESGIGLYWFIAFATRMLSSDTIKYQISEYKKTKGENK